MWPYPGLAELWYLTAGESDEGEMAAEKASRRSAALGITEMQQLSASSDLRKLSCRM